jgi:hypothetical protein
MNAEFDENTAKDGQNKASYTQHRIFAVAK